MLKRIQLFFAPPVFPQDPEKTRQAAVLNTLLLITLAFLVLDLLVAVPIIYTEKFINALAALFMLAVVGLCFWWMRTGGVRLASFVFISIVWLTFTLYMLFSNGLQSIMAVYYVAGTAIVGLLFGRKGAIISGVVCSLAGLAMVGLSITGNTFPVLFPVGPIASWINLTVALWMTATVLNLVLRNLNESLSSAQKQLDESSHAAEGKTRQVDYMRSLFSIEQAVLSSMDLNQILSLLVREVVKQLHVDAVSVLLVNPQTQRLDFAAGEGFRTQALRYTRLEIGSGLAGQAAQELKTIYIADLGTLDNPVLTQSIARENFTSYYGVPLFGKDQLQGVLEIFHRSPLEPDPEWLAVLEALAAQAAISIHNANLLESTQQSLKETNALYRISQSLARSLDPEQLMKDVVDVLFTDFGFYHVQIFLMRPDGNALVASHGSGKHGRKLMEEGYQLAVGAGIIGHVAQIGEPFTTNAVDQVLFYIPNPLLPETQSEMAIPIQVEGRVQGVLDIQQNAPGRLSERQMHLMSAVADQLAVALQKANLYAELQYSLGQEKTMREQLIQNERLALVGRLLASVSHELNNPIQAIQNALFLIKEEESFSEQGKQDLEIIISETDRMAALIDRLRTAYRPTRSDDYHEVQLNELVEYVRTLTATHMRHNDIRFEYVPDPDLPPISGIPEQLRQVILNLFMNAIEAMRSGGSLTVRSQSLQDEQKVLLTFTDSGQGIDPQLMPHIFEPFITDKDTGTGLGLTITYDIIQKHNGMIRAENNPQGGATFSVWLPVKREG